MRTVIPGSGSLGIIIGSLIAKNRRQVDRVDSYKENVDALNAKGATVLLCPRRSFDRQKVRLLRLVAPHALQPRVVAGHDHGDGGDERRHRQAEQRRCRCCRSRPSPARTRVGPSHPPRLPTALIMAMPPAAATPVSMALGIDQKIGSRDCWPIIATHSAIIVTTGWLTPMRTQAASPPAASNAAPATCQVRSPVRSEWQPQEDHRHEGAQSRAAR